MMNEQELRQLKANRNVEQVLGQLSALTEKQRKDLAPTSLKLLEPHTNITRNLSRHSIPLSTERVGSYGFMPHDLADPAGHEISKIAVLATCSFSDIKKLGFSGIPEPDNALKVLLARKPSWINSWSNLVLNLTGASHWLAVYRLEQTLQCTIAHDSLYLTGMCAGLALQPDMVDLVATEALIHDDYVYAMLADSTCIGFLCHPERNYFEDYYRGIQGRKPLTMQQQAFSRETINAWLRCLRALVERKIYNRDHIKSIVFSSLLMCADNEEKHSARAIAPDDRSVTGPWQNQTDFSIALARCCLMDDWSNCERELATLCGAANSKVAVFALRALVEISPDKLSIPVILSNIGASLQSKWKTPAESALNLLSLIATVEDVDKSELAEVISIGFENKSKAIHSKTLKLLEILPTAALTGLLPSIKHRLDNLKGLERQKANSLCEHSASPQIAIAIGSVNSPANEPARTENQMLIDRAQSLQGSAFSSIVQLERTLIDARNNILPDLSAVNLWSYDFPRLDPDETLSLIDNEDDLIYALAQLLEGFTSPMDRERIMDACSRLCGGQSTGFAQKAEALKQKVDWKVSSDKPSFSQKILPWHNLVHAYLDDSLLLEWPYAHDFFLAQRLEELCARMRKGQAASLLSAPTHKNGWIEPGIFVQRLIQWQEKELSLDRADFIQALLRLAPEGRDGALRAAQHLVGLSGEVARYALGSADFNPKEKLSLWIAAFRAREPYSDSPELDALAPGLPPDGPIAAKYSFDSEEIYNSWSFELPNFLPVQSFDPEFPLSRERRRRLGTIDLRFVAPEIERRQKYSLLPTCLLHDNGLSYAQSLPPYVWPQNRESFIAILAKRIANHDWKIETFNLDLLFHPDQPMDGNAKWFLAYSLGAVDDKTLATAIDLLISVISEARLHPGALGDCMAKLALTKEVKHSNFTKALREVSKASILHSYFCFLATSTLLHNAYRTMSSSAKIGWLEYLLDVKEKLGFTVASELKDLFEIDKSSGKTGKLACKLIEKDDCVSAQTRSAINEALLNAKVDRLQRWHHWAADYRLESCNSRSIFQATTGDA